MRASQPTRPLLILAALALVLCGLALAPIPPARSQADIATIEIVAIDAGQFPDVSVQARVLDSAGMPVLALPADTLVLLENDAERPSVVQPVEVSVQTVLVAGLGPGSDEPGASGAARADEVREVIARTIEGMGVDDAAAIVRADASGVAVLQPVTADRDALRVAAGQIAAADGDQPPDLAAALRQALDQLAAPSPDGQAQAVIVVATGAEPEQQAAFAEVEALAASRGVPIHAVLSSAEVDGEGNGLLRLAQNTGGRFTAYGGEATLTPLYDGLLQQRRQYRLSFRSSLSTSGERSVAIATRDGGPAGPRGAAIYVVEVLPPVVVIDQPQNGADFLRQAVAFDQALDTVQPTTASVSAHVEWPDGHPRGVSTAQLVVDGEPYGAVQLDPGEALSFVWDLRAYRDVGQTIVQLQAQVTDELGHIATSAPLVVTVSVDVPPPPVEQQAGCAGAGDLVDQVVCSVNELGGVLALIITIPTLILAIIAWHNRGQISTAVSHAGEAITDGVARITRPVDEGRHAEAFLVVLRGDPYLIGKRFPVYANTVTPLGRDRSQVEIVFADEENSVISRKHCEIRQDGNGFRLRDFASTYGTFLNGARLPELTVEELHHGDEIGLGPIERGGVLLRFELLLQDGVPSDFNDTQPAPD